MFIIGLYAVTKRIYSKDIKTVSFLCKIAMPFYMLHQAVLHGVSRFVKQSLSYDKQYPELAFATTLALTTFLTWLLSYLVYQSPNSVRYCFGLPPKIKETSEKSYLQKCSPIFFLILIRMIGCIAVSEKYVWLKLKNALLRQIKR